ncbi:DUF6925 family protein [Methylobacterium sp. J-070]|uniref:DUF6925 family protein n=1 Tax=Methylobacterium sp. J-070 TaxID=2836650 RepID=UPI001FBBBBF7|nr:hypothetical protein [Methylobacterium sp. J-070]MCJ2054288.1 hypothetical protein [Methylobacterium sp. J-070]
MTDGPRRSVEALLRAQLADPACTWSLGGYGAAATFARDPDEPVERLDSGGSGLVTGRGAVRLAVPPDLRPFAYETGFTGGWSQTVALCLPASACAMGRRRVLTELGADAAAVRPQDRAALLFDLGLGLEAADACLRVADPALIDRLRSGLGRSILSPDNPAGPALAAPETHRVFVTRLGRIEIFAPEAGCGTGGPGPQSHVLPKLLALRRTHPATAPIPPGLVPCGGFHPAHPVRDGAGRAIPFDAARHAAFGRLLDAWGDPALVALRRTVLAGRESDPARSAGRFERSAIRAARAQLLALRG